MLRRWEMRDQSGIARMRFFSRRRAVAAARYWNKTYAANGRSDVWTAARRGA